MKFFFDFFPILAFFVVYKWQGIYPATVVAMIAGCGQVGYAWLVHRRVEAVHWLTLGLILVFGTATLVLKNPRFIQWKPTILQWFMAVLFGASHFIGSKPMIRRMLDAQLVLPDMVWIRLSVAWIGFFLISGVLNLFVAYHFDENTWVNFKLFGLLGMTILFIIVQGFYLSSYLEEKSPEKEG